MEDATCSVPKDRGECEPEFMPPPVNQQICVVGDLKDDYNVMRAIKRFGARFKFSTCMELLDANDSTYTVFIVNKDMEGPLCAVSHQPWLRVLGRTAFLELAEKVGKTVFRKDQPLLPCHAMAGLILRFSGFPKEQLIKLEVLVKCMGASTRKEMSGSVTHLVVNGCNGYEYQYAITFGVPVLSESWVHSAWGKHKELGFSAAAPEFISDFKLKPFHGAKVCFLGFPEKERLHMEEVLVENGGIVANTSECTHMVVDKASIPEVSQSAISHSFHIVTPKWFWISVQSEGAADAAEYKINVEQVVSPTSRLSLGTPTSAGHKKRKRLCDAHPYSPSSPKRSLSICDASRQEVFHELVETETNYVGVLNTILTIFKEPLEEMLKGGRPLLDNSELQTIFGNLHPIYELHSKMLEELCLAKSHWTDTTSIGNIMLNHSRDMAMVKAYSPFVNYFEQAKRMLNNCDQTKPRFNAFLKQCQSKPECGRQTLNELLIRPVQRLGSIELLLAQILKHTSMSNPDHSRLEKALKAIKDGTKRINEDKRKMDVCSEIDSCPVLSTNSTFVTCCHVKEQSNELDCGEDSLALFLFSDVLEVCKKRSRMAGSLQKHTPAHFKHVRLIPLSDIKRVFDVLDRVGSKKESQYMFALKCRGQQELKEKLYCFTCAEDVDKSKFLEILCRQLVKCRNTQQVYKGDAASFFSRLDYGELDISCGNDSPFATLSRAYSKLSSRTGSSLSLSFDKTPNRFRQAMTTIRSSFGSAPNLFSAPAR